MLNKSVSVVIPNYNGRDLLEQNLPSVFAALKKARIPNYEIIIPDDCSTDTSVSFLKERYPEIHLIISETNQGFSKNINKGIRSAKMDLVMLLNSDMVLEDDYFIPSLSYFENESVFGVMGIVNDTPQRIYHLSLIGLVPWKKNEYHVNGSKGPMLLMSGGNSLVDREKLQFLEGFDEGFSPFYGEDDELGIRANRMGWKFFFENKSVCYHNASSTISKHHRKKSVSIIAKRNKLYLNSIHLNTLRLTIYWLIQTLKLLTYWILFKFSFYQSFWLFTNMIGRVRKRREIMSKTSRYSFARTVRMIFNEQVKYAKA